MVAQPVVSETSLGDREARLLILFLAATWIAVVGVLVVMLLHGARETGAFEGWRLLLQGIYVVVLLLYLGRSGLPLKELPMTGPRRLQRSENWQLVTGALIALLLALNVLSDDGDDILLLLLMAATLWLLVAWRRKIRLRWAALGLLLAAIAFLAGLPAWLNGMLTVQALVLLTLFTWPMFIVGCMLLDRTGVGGCPLSEGRYRKALVSFLKGCALFVPLGLVNAAEGSPGSGFTWVTEWWMPISLPLFSGIAEEAWFRLLLVSICYFLLRPVFDDRPEVAVILALLFSATVFGLGHGRTFGRFLTTGLLYGLPMAAVFAKRDWEHAVGAHYMINLIPWLMVFQQNQG